MVLLAKIFLYICKSFNYFLFKKTENVYNFNLSFVIFAYVFYSICVFGFFMGVPLFNLFLGPVAAVYMAIRIKQKSQKFDIKSTAHNVAHFSTDVLLFVCVASGYLALSDTTTAANLEGMFNLSFDITRPMLWSIIVLGGLIMVLINYFFCVYVFKKVYSKTN